MKLATAYSLFLLFSWSYLCFASETEACKDGRTLESTLQTITNNLAHIRECIQGNMSENPSMAVEIKQVIEKEERSLHNEIKMLKKIIESSLPQPSVTPAFQWAQGSNEIFLNIKFSHKLDAPATLNVQPTNVNLTNQELRLEASDGRKNFNLHIVFLHEIDPDNSTWSLGSVGRMVFHIRKNQEKPSRWKRLLKSEKRLAQMHYWYEMGEKYSKELDEIEDTPPDDSRKRKGTPEDYPDQEKRDNLSERVEMVNEGKESKDFDETKDGVESKLEPKKPSMLGSFGL